MKVLICESEEILLAAIEFRLKKIGLEVVYSKKRGTILEAISMENPDLIIVDADMGKQAGLEIIQQIQDQNAAANILLPILSALMVCSSSSGSMSNKILAAAF